jgi:hypothetical protein
MFFINFQQTPAFDLLHGAACFQLSLAIAIRPLIVGMGTGAPIGGALGMGPSVFHPKACRTGISDLAAELACRTHGRTPGVQIRLENESLTRNFSRRAAPRTP